MGSKLFIPQDVLDTIVCLTCSNYLSVFPVYTKIDGTGAVCGRCRVVDEDKYIRDEAYEGIAQFLIFPCRHSNSGCGEHLTPPKLEDHERCCEFRKFDCPSKNYSKCAWKGARAELTEHFNQKHPALLLKEPNFELNFVNSQEECLLLPNGEELFVLKKEVDSRKGLFSCSVEHLKATEDSESYNYFLRLESGNKEYFYRCADKSTCDNDRLNSTQLTVDILRDRLHDPASIVVNVMIVKAITSQTDSDQAAKGEPVKPDIKKDPNINWEMLAELECPICYDYVLPPIYQCLSGHSFCEVCKKKVTLCPICKGAIQDTKNFVLEKMTQLMTYPCKYHKNGCQYSTKTPEIRDHENCCEFGPYACPLKDSDACEWKASHAEVAEHIDNNHHDSILQTDKVDIPLNKQQTSEKSYLVKYNKKMFKLFYKYENSKFFWCVQLVGPPNEAKQYRFEIDIVDLSGSKRRCYHMGIVASLTPQNECFQNPGKYVVAPLEQIEPFVNTNLSYRVRIVKECKGADRSTAVVKSTCSQVPSPNNE